MVGIPQCGNTDAFATLFSVLLIDAYSQSLFTFPHSLQQASIPFFFFQTVQCPLLDSRVPPFTKDEGQSCEKTVGSVKDTVNAKG